MVCSPCPGFSQPGTVQPFRVSTLSRQRKIERTMELPDESISYNYQGLLVPAAEEWTAAAELRAHHFITSARLKELHQRLLQCRSQVAAERELRNPPAEQLPLEPGFINLPQELLDNFRRKQDASDLGKTI